MRTSSATFVTAVAAVLALGLAGCGTGTPETSSSTPPVASPTTTSGTPQPSGSVTSTTPTQSPTGVAALVPVYWAGDTTAGTRLYREFLRTTAPAGPTGTVEAALDLMLAGRPADPDYRSLWPPAVRLDAVTVDGDTADVALTGPITDGARDSRSMDVQQLVYTVTAAQPSIRSVEIMVNGSPLVARPVGRAPTTDVLAPIWIIDPQEGATVGQPLRFGGSASVFEAQLQWQVMSDGHVVRAGDAMATIGAPERGTWSVTVRGLAPGQYRVVAFDVSMKDGRREFTDDKTVTVG